MAITRREEQRLLSAEEFAMLKPSHHPQLGTLAAEDLRGLVFRLRQQHNRSRDLIREAARARRGKDDARAAASAAEKLSQKKQVFAAGVRRVNAQFARKLGETKKQRNTEKLREALERRRAAKPHHPQPGRSAGDGMQDISSERAHRGVDPRAIGSISQRTRDAQAKRDG